jgi:hypothetical protein
MTRAEIKKQLGDRYRGAHIAATRYADAEMFCEKSKYAHYGEKPKAWQPCGPWAALQSGYLQGYADAVKELAVK